MVADKLSRFIQQGVQQIIQANKDIEDSWYTNKLETVHLDTESFLDYGLDDNGNLRRHIHDPSVNSVACMETGRSHM